MHPLLNRLGFLMQDVQHPIRFNEIIGIGNVKDVLILAAIGLDFGVRAKDTTEN